nr:hypothetical protein [Acidiphilium sp.]
MGAAADRRGFRQLRHVESEAAEAPDMVTDVGADAGGEGGRHRLTLLRHDRKNLAQIDDVGEHYRTCDQADVFHLLFLFNGIAAPDHWPAEADPVKKLLWTSIFVVSARKT